MQSQWTFLTNHAHVILYVSQNPDSTLREIAERVGITERAAHRIVVELEAVGALTRRRDGRRNHYEICPDFPLRHPLERHCTVGRLLKTITDRRNPNRPDTRPSVNSQQS